MGLLKQAIHYHDARLSEKNYIEIYSLKKKKKGNMLPNDFGCTAGNYRAANLKLRLSWSPYLRLHTLADKENAE